MRRLVVATILASAIGASGADAAPILSPVDPGSIVASVVTDPGATTVLGYDVSIPAGMTSVTVQDGASLLELLLAVDDVPPPGTATHLVLGDLTATEFAFLTFNFSAGVFDGLGGWTVPGLVVPAATVTDPALLAVLGPVSAQFQFSQQVAFDNAVANVFALEQVTAVPEPATINVLGLGLALTAGRRMRRFV